jgi:hypothetical protein
MVVNTVFYKGAGNPGSRMECFIYILYVVGIDFILDPGYLIQYSRVRLSLSYGFQDDDTSGVSFYILH